MAEAGSPVDELIDRVRGGGGRVTRARRAVLESFLEGGDHHLTAEEVAARVHARHPEIHLSTVYRSLEVFEEAGVVLHVHLGHGPSVYHLAKDLHHHAVCDRCSAVIQLPLGVLDDLAARLRAEHGFEVTGHHFAIVGRCRACAGGL
jgi:Fur family transcriptional regulator, ferric uptake regulator